MVLDSDTRRLRFALLPGQFAVCHFSADAFLPKWALQGSFTSVTRTADELSIVCPADNLPEELEPGTLWRCLKLAGPFAFTETGILSSFLQPLAHANIGIFAVSTYETDYVLIQEQFATKAVAVLREAGHVLI